MYLDPASWNGTDWDVRPENETIILSSGRTADDYIVNPSDFMNTMYPANGTREEDVVVMVPVQVKQVHIVIIVMFSTLTAFSLVTACIFAFRYRRHVKKQQMRRRQSILNDENSESDSGDTMSSEDENEYRRRFKEQEDIEDAVSEIYSEI